METKKRDNGSFERLMTAWTCFILPRISKSTIEKKWFDQDLCFVWNVKV